MYRYRDNSGVTQLSLKAAERHISKVGSIRWIKGYRYNGRYHTTHEGVMVKGDKGTARFSGFCWGYGGEGPRGLIKFLTSIGVPKDTAESVAFRTNRGDAVGIDWSIIFNPEIRIVFQAGRGQ